MHWMYELGVCRMRLDEAGVVEAAVEIVAAAPDDRLDLLVHHCARLTRAAAVSLTEAAPDGTLMPGIASGATADHLMRVELSDQAGPTLDCSRHGRAIHGAPLLPNGPWPAVAEVARTAGLATVDAVPVSGGSAAFGVLSLYSTPPSSLGPTDRATATALAAITGIAIAQSRDVARAEHTAHKLREAIDQRLVIEQAKGLLAGRDGTTPDEALTNLTDQARSQGTELHTAAASIISAHINEGPPAVTARCARRQES